ncbi:acetyl/propionyl/methylcrotonyl-CoA carboxylase subunit alpha [uncultured Maricaulis sp.]|uniref:acetyl/propionyl/methylcrotonyl-CoA carboxylase subunit alpha n=1 Tax=uncultured Maricaulis sp. TaxID=174710 RepID=UPI0030D6EDA8|tara:strand:+ start:25119 stop:27122 length:2004 start_codon:yes stop_codon:yes gene_type:complete
MIKTLLIANRGEIACRIMRTAQAMGIRCVAVYSEADADALHVRMADEAVLIGPAPAADSYLRADKILAAATSTGADAVHPGYGFLSENAEFADACSAKGIIFVGPSAASIRAMGLKDRAKALMETAGVPVTPGYHGENQDPDHLKAAAEMIGYPVLIKAVAGGGGKGMRKVERAADFLADLESCKREASKSFGDDRVLIEKFITNPRHIEVQVFGDSRGRVVHMYERDCSLQRRHQKVIEEAPAPGMTPAVRTAMCSAAINAARAVDYVGAGTVEFIVDGSGPLREDGFFFMEMNTRLQVEHPVTEMITGLDLVELQLKVAAGGSVPEQDMIGLHGHAIEARLYAEDPVNGFLPSIGVLHRLSLPGDSIDERVETGVEEGGEVSLHYDPMIAKLVAHGESRREAALRLAGMLDELVVWPVKTNAGFLRRAVLHPDFLDARLNTGFIETHLDALVPSAFDLADAGFAVLGALDLRPLLADLSDPFDIADGWRMNGTPRISHRFELDGDLVDVSLLIEGDRLNVRAGGESAQLDGLEIEALDEGFLFAADCGGEAITAEFEPMDQGYLVSSRGRTSFFALSHPDAAVDALEAGDTIKAPMPGKVLAVHVSAGDAVVKGQALVVLEAMKMEHALVAPRDGSLAEVRVEAGAQVAEGDILVLLHELDAGAD